MYRLLLLASIFVAFTLNSTAQTTTYTITGRIIDDQANPLPGASIVDRNSQLGVVSDRDGNFTLEVYELPVYLEISFIGFATHYQAFEREDFSDEGKVVINVQLNTVAQLLSEAVVKGKYEERFFTVRNVMVLDFTFVNDLTLLLLKERSEFSLALINEAGDSIADLKLDFNARGFIKDCLDHIYVVGPDSVHGLSFDKDRILRIGAINQRWYDARVKPCVAVNSLNLYYQFYGDQDQLVTYYQTPFGAEESKLLRTIGDEDNANSMAEYTYDARRAREQGLIKKSYDMMAWYHTILRQPEYSPLFATNNGAVIFDHFKDSVVVLNPEGQVVKRYAIEHHKDRDFNKRIIRDEVSGIYYAYIERKGLVELVALSPDDFSTRDHKIVKGVSFPQALKVRNGIAYYLDHSEDDYERLKLYRTRL